MELMNRDINWDTNLGYGVPFFSVIVTDRGCLRLNCYDEYIVELSDKGLRELKEAVDLAYSTREKLYGKV